MLSGLLQKRLVPLHREILMRGDPNLSPWNPAPISAIDSKVRLAALLIAVLPANIYMAMAPAQFGGFLDHPLYHWIRIPFQGVLIAWVLWCVRVE